MPEALMVATVTGMLSLTGTLIGTYFSQKKSTALIVYRIEQLEKKVEEHNNMVDRVYKIERDLAIQGERLDNM